MGPRPLPAGDGEGDDEEHPGRADEEETDDVETRDPLPDGRPVGGRVYRRGFSIVGFILSHGDIAPLIMRRGSCWTDRTDSTEFHLTFELGPGTRYDPLL